MITSGSYANNGKTAKSLKQCLNCNVAISTIESHMIAVKNKYETLEEVKDSKMGASFWEGGGQGSETTV